MSRRGGSPKRLLYSRLAVVDLLERIAARHEGTPAQIALDINLTAADLSDIAAAMAQIKVIGHRY